VEFEALRCHLRNSRVLTRLRFPSRRHPISFVRIGDIASQKGAAQSMHAMRAISIIAVLLLMVVSALELLPVATPLQPYLAVGAMALSVVALIAMLVGRSPALDTRGAAAAVARPTAAPSRSNQADAEIISFLAMLQGRGRLVDFLMDDINSYSDAQVGTAARVVHSGCKAALLEHFRISPVRTESEGSTVQVAAGYSPDEYDRKASGNRSSGGGAEINGTSKLPLTGAEPAGQMQLLAASRSATLEARTNGPSTRTILRS
jgi:uncharacterized protein DUF2760